jgi:rhodanese-related sulfurtransferase
VIARSASSSRRVRSHLVAALLAAAMMAGLQGCGGAEERDAQARGAAAERESPYASAAARAVRDVRSGDAVLLDVRTPEEFEAGHAADVVHLPLQRLKAGERPDVPMDAKLYVYCRTGRRAAEAAALLRRAGYRDVTNIGGLSDWRAAGGATRRSAGG